MYTCPLQALETPGFAPRAGTPALFVVAPNAKMVHWESLKSDGERSPMKPQDDLRTQVLRSMALTTAIGFDLACVLLVCVVVGHYVDGRLHSTPWGLLIGIVVGLVGGFASAYRLIKRLFP